MFDTLDDNHVCYYNFDSGFWGTLKKKSLDKCLKALTIKLNKDIPPASKFIGFEIENKDEVKAHLDSVYNVLDVKSNQRIYTWSRNIESDNIEDYFLGWVDGAIPQLATLYKMGDESIANLFNELKFYIMALSEFELNGNCMAGAEF